MMVKHALIYQTGKNNKQTNQDFTVFYLRFTWILHSFITYTLLTKLQLKGKTTSDV